MKNYSKLFVIATAAFLIGISAANFSVSAVPSNFKVAVVDIQKIVSSSAEVQALKTEQKQKSDELVTFINKAKTAIDKEKDAKKKKALEDKYNKEFQLKRENIAKNYETKLLEIDKNISSVISSKAKSEGYNLVLAKGVVLSGGTDITDAISAQIK